ncbi:MAG: hypothetical protein AAF800_11140 [Planctomycetota bacterium]
MDMERTTGKAAWTGAMGLGVVFLLAAAGGCQGTPFKDAERLRTPYERYQTLRGEARPKTVTDSFGKEQPALRARLSPLDEL